MELGLVFLFLLTTKTFLKLLDVLPSTSLGLREISKSELGGCMSGFYLVFTWFKGIPECGHVLLFSLCPPKDFSRFHMES